MYEFHHSLFLCPWNSYWNLATACQFHCLKAIDSIDTREITEKIIHFIATNAFHCQFPPKIYSESRRNQTTRCTTNRYMWCYLNMKSVEIMSRVSLTFINDLHAIECVLYCLTSAITNMTTSTTTTLFLRSSISFLFVTFIAHCLTQFHTECDS